MSGIRVTYTGLISFTVGIISVFTGLIFTLIVTRRLTPDEFGTWGLIGSLLVYALIIQSGIGYWTTREIARGLKSGKTAVISSGLFSTVGLVIYITMAYFVSLKSDASQEVLFFASILIPLQFMQTILTAINLGWKPQAVSYSLLVFESAKIPAAIIFVYFLDMGIVGAIITTSVAHIMSITILTYYTKDKLKVSFEKSFLYKWVKLSWLPIYGNIQNMILYLDVITFTVITGSVVGLAFYSSSIAVASIVNYSSLIYYALYSKLLEGGKKEYLQENFTSVLYFAIPLLALCIVFAKPALFALNPQYVNAYPIVVIIAIKTFFHIIRDLFESALSGIEKVDTNEKSTWKDFVKSKLFFLPTIRIIHNSLYVGILTVVLLSFMQQNVSALNLVIYWSMVALVIQIPFTLYTYYLAKKRFTIKIPKVNILKYVCTTVIIFGITYLLTEHFLEYRINIFEFLPTLLLFVGFSVLSYLLITYLIDSRTKRLLNTAIYELRKK
ncbi:MAG: hypothetical protein WEB28_02020 [Nitrosopumilaceae archaeon]